MAAGLAEVTGGSATSPSAMSPARMFTDNPLFCLPVLRRTSRPSIPAGDAAGPPNIFAAGSAKIHPHWSPSTNQLSGSKKSKHSVRRRHIRTEKESRARHGAASRRAVLKRLYRILL